MTKNPMVIGEYYTDEEDYEARQEQENEKADMEYDRLYR